MVTIEIVDNVAKLPLRQCAVNQVISIPFFLAQRHLSANAV